MTNRDDRTWPAADASDDDFLERLFGPRHDFDELFPKSEVVPRTAHDGAGGEMTADEITQMAELQAHETEFYYQQNGQRAWEREQRAKAPKVLALLRQHIPVDRLREVEELLSTGYGCDCLREALPK